MARATATTARAGRARGSRRGLVPALVALAWSWGAGAPARGDEARFRRQGFTIGVGIGPATLAGTGLFDGIAGGGGGGTLRVGTTATPTLLWILQADTAGVPIRRGGGNLTANQHAALTLGAQWYVRDALWLKGGAGLALLDLRAAENDAPGTRHRGLALLGSGGYDLFRRGIFALDLEVVAAGGIYGSNDFIAHLGVNLAAQWY